MTHTHHDAAYWTRRHTETVVLDIGEDIGALVLYTPADLFGHEIEVSPLGPPGSATRRTHSAVLERSCNGRVFYAAVYPELRAGDYQVHVGGSPRCSIHAGQVAEVHLPVTDGRNRGLAEATPPHP
jgi:hypothetical protein